MNTYKCLQTFHLSLYTLRPRAIASNSPDVLASKSCKRFQSYNRFSGRKPQYNRFDRAQQFRDRWNRDPRFRYLVSAGGIGAVGFYTYNLDRVPVSGRLRFNCVPTSFEQSTSMASYQGIMQEYRGRILPSWHPHSQMVRKVLKRLIPHSGLEGQDWAVHVIDDDENKNAFVIPG